MNVIDRSGKEIPFIRDKIKAHTDRATEGHASLDGDVLLERVVSQITDGMTTIDIQNTIIRTAVDMIDIDVPDWTFAAGRAMVYAMRKNSNGTGEYGTLSDYITDGVKSANLNPVLKEFDLDLLDEYVVPDRDLLFNYLGIKTMNDRYLVNKPNFKELPQHMFMAIAMFLATNEKEEDKHDKAIEFYNLLSQLEAMSATPTLSNCRFLSGQLSSCYVQSTPDNIEGIFNGYKEAALESKGGGGIGWDWTATRAGGSEIDGHTGASGGLIPFLKVTDSVSIAVDQLGMLWTFRLGL